MKQYGYYPGCSLHGTAREYAESSRMVCDALEISLRELDDWNCCGASSAHMTNPWLGMALVARNLQLAERDGLQEIVLPCASCYARFKDTLHALHETETANKVAELVGEAVSTDFAIVSLLELLSRDEYLADIRSRTKTPLHGLKLAPYYGCLLTRPQNVAQFDDPEDPQSLDVLLRELGAEVVRWPGKVTCCGASLPISRTDIVLKMADRLLTWAEKSGADAIVTACPMCHSNLDTRQGEMHRAGIGDHHMPIYYFTELIGVAFGHAAGDLGVGRHLTEARSLLADRLTPVGS